MRNQTRFASTIRQHSDNRLNGFSCAAEWPLYAAASSSADRSQRTRPWGIPHLIAVGSRQAVIHCPRFGLLGTVPRFIIEPRILLFPSKYNGNTSLCVIILHKMLKYQFISTVYIAFIGQSLKTSCVLVRGKQFQRSLYQPFRSSKSKQTVRPRYYLLIK